MLYKTKLQHDRCMLVSVIRADYLFIKSQVCCGIYGGHHKNTCPLEDGSEITILKAYGRAKEKRMCLEELRPSGHSIVKNTGGRGAGSIVLGFELYLKNIYGYDFSIFLILLFLDRYFGVFYSDLRASPPVCLVMKCPPPPPKTITAIALSLLRILCWTSINVCKVSRSHSLELEMIELNFPLLF